MYLIRHGPTRNPNIILGQQDQPLSRLIRGRSFSTKIFKYENPIILSSPLKRAIETANLFGFDQPQIDHRIAEMNLGEFEGKPKNAENMEALRNLISNPTNNWYNGESLQVFVDRVNEFYYEYRDSDIPVIVFTHSGVIRHITSQLLGLKPLSYQPNYLEIIEIDPNQTNIRQNQIRIKIQ